MPWQLTLERLDPRGNRFLDIKLNGRGSTCANWSRECHPSQSDEVRLGTYVFLSGQRIMLNVKPASIFLNAYTELHEKPPRLET